MSMNRGSAGVYFSEAWSCPHCPTTYRPPVTVNQRVAERLTRKARDGHRCPPVLPPATS